MDTSRSAIMAWAWYVYLLARHMQFPVKVQKSYEVYKMIIPARLVQKCFETSILYIGKLQASLVQELRSRSTFVQRRAVF